MKSEYRSGKTVGKNQTVPIDANDRRLRWDKKGPTKGRQGAEIDVVGLNTTLSNQTLYQNLTMSNTTGSNVVSGSVPYIGSTVIAYGSHLGVYPGGSGPYVLIPTDPTNVTATWVGNDLKIEFDFDITDPVNIVVSQFIISLTANGETQELGGFAVDRTQKHQTLTLTKTMNIKMFNIFTPKITGICVKAADPLNNISNTVCALNIPTYVLDLNKPEFTLANANNGYVVTITNTAELKKDAFDAIDIWEIESTSSTAPDIIYAADGYTPTNYSRVYFSSINPATVISPNLNQRWVIARFSSAGGIYTDFADAKKANPTSVVNVDLLPPNDVSAVSAVWNNQNGINITYTMPSTDPGVRFIVNLVPTANSSALGSFYLYPSSPTGTQTLTINKSDLYLQFGTYYIQFTGLIKSVDAADNRTAGISFNVAAIGNSLSSITPNPSMTAIVDGYVVSVSNETANVDHVEVYEYFADPTTMLASMGTLMDYMDATYVSGGTSGSNTIVLNNWQDQMQMGVVNPEYCYGMAITGTGIPANTYVTSVTVGPSSNYTVHLSNNLTQQASGSYHMPALVAAGTSPLSVYTGNYIKRWVIVVYYDIFGNNSLFGKANPAYVTPINPTTSLFDTAIQISSTGSIYLGSSKTSVPNVLIGTNNAEAGIFVWGPNDGPTTSGTPSTQIIGAANSPLTFITQNAQIADWVITPFKIENTLNSLSGSTYTGLSGTGTYAFWAGSSATGSSGPTSDSQSSFWVKKDGSVQATKISIVGDGTNNVSLNINNVFTVNKSGKVTITGSADITGKITADSGSFTGNISIGSAGSIYSGTVTAGTPPTLTGQGFILNQNGLRFNSSTVPGITTIDGTTGKLITSSASIGGWSVNSTSISRVSSTNHGTISLDSSNGYISVSDASVSGYTAGINGPSTTSDTVFWAGNGGATGSNNFRVTLAGSLYATGATITGGQVVSQGNSINNITNKITIDGPNDLIKFSSGTNNAYIIPRNNNLYITAPSSTDPWSGSTTPGTSTATPTNAPYFAAGSSFKDSWNNTVSGIGLYTGQWDYFTYGSSSPFVTATTTGLQLSAGPQIGMIMEPGGKTGSVLATAGALIYTSTDPTTKGPSKKYGAYILAEQSKLTMYSNNPDSGSFPYGGIIIDGTTGQQGTFIYAGNSSGNQMAYAGFNSSGIILQSNTSNVQQTIDDTSIRIAVGTNTYGLWKNSAITMQATSSVYGTWDSTGIKLQSSTTNYGSWTSSGIKFQSGLTAYTTWDSNGVTISPTSGSSTYMQVDGSQIKSTTTVASGYYYGSDGIQHNNPQTQSIILGTDGLHINGLSVYGDDSRLSSISNSYSPFTRVIQYAPQNQSNGNTQINGGDAVTGFAVYYGNHSPVGTTGTGFSGDLWVQI
jgi:hypothetical protein